MYFSTCIFLNKISTLYSIWDTRISLSYEMPNLSIFLNALAGMIKKTLNCLIQLPSILLPSAYLNSYFFSPLLTNKTIFLFLIGKQVYLHILYLTLTSKKHLCDITYYHQLQRDSYHSTCMDVWIMKRQSIFATIHITIYLFNVIKLLRYFKS